MNDQQVNTCLRVGSIGLTITIGLIVAILVIAWVVLG